MSNLKNSNYYSNYILHKSLITSGFESLLSHQNIDVKNTASPVLTSLKANNYGVFAYVA